MARRETREAMRDKSVIVTGSSRGIGLTTAQAFLDAGARVAICARDPSRLGKAAAHLHAGERLLARVADVSDFVHVQSFVEQATSAFGPVEVLVNNAGLAHVGPFAEEPVESIGNVIDVNLKGLMYVTRAVLPSMLARGSGVIVNVSSGAGLAGFPQIVSYCATKFGVVGFTEGLDEEVRAYGVRVYVLCPGRVATDMQAQYSGAKVGIAPERVAQRILDLALGKRRLMLKRCLDTIG